MPAHPRVLLTTVLSVALLATTGCRSPKAAPAHLAPAAPVQTAAPGARPTLAAANLLADAGWECLPGAEVGGGGVAIGGFDEFRTLLNAYRIRLLVRGDFSVSAKLEAGPRDFCGLDFWGSLPGPTEFASWRATAPRVQVALASGHVHLRVFERAGDKPVFQFTSRGRAFLGAVSVRLQKAGGRLALFIEGVEAAGTTALGPFGEGPLYLGATVGPNANLVLRELSLENAADPPGARVERAPLLAGAAASSPGPKSLRSLAASKGRVVGVGGILPRWFRWNPAYQSVVAREFSSLADGFSFDWRVTQPRRNSFRFCDTDQMVAFARTNGLQVDAKFLTWGNKSPDWLENGRFSRGELMDILHQHIQTVAGRYRGQIAVWQVGNEVLDYKYESNGAMRDTVWSTGIGSDYLDLAFRWAREADPKARLILNETGAEGLDRKADGFYELVKGLRARGVPIDGVGMQMHWWRRGGSGDQGKPSPRAVASNMKRLADLGLDVYITEMDVPVRERATPEELAAQARTYHDMLAVCLAASNCKGLTTWGLSDGDSWLRERPRFQGLAAPLLFDEALRPKLAYSALLDALVGR